MMAGGYGPEWYYVEHASGIFYKSTVVEAYHEEDALCKALSNGFPGGIDPEEAEEYIRNGTYAEEDMVWLDPPGVYILSYEFLVREATPKEIEKANRKVGGLFSRSTKPRFKRRC